MSYNEIIMFGSLIVTFLCLIFATLELRNAQIIVKIYEKRLEEKEREFKKMLGKAKNVTDGTTTSASDFSKAIRESNQKLQDYYKKEGAIK